MVFKLETCNDRLKFKKDPRNLVLCMKNIINLYGPLIDPWCLSINDKDDEIK